ncbi:MAG: serine/threonine-protein kinase [Marmoricola sp.]
MRTPDRADEPLVWEGLVGQLLAQRYRVAQRIARGGMASVYRARDEHLGRDVALKVFHRGLTSPEDLRRQRGEVNHLARLAHPNLVTLYDAISEEGEPGFLVLEYVRGRDLRARMQAEPLPLADLAAIGRDIADALAYLHSRGVVHRDISPGNILLPAATPRDRGIAAKLTDLGIARVVDAGQITATETLLGTAAYLSPEQVRGHAVSGASDIYSLGLVLLESLTGRRAFGGPATESALARLHHDPDIPDHLPAEWRDLIFAMTMRDPEQRPSAAEVAQRLGEVSLSSGAVTTAELTEPLFIPPHSRPTGSSETRVLDVTPARVRWVPIAVAAVLVVALALVLLAVLPGDQKAAATKLRYPAVPGRLGTHLAQLEHDVSPQSNE